MARISRLQAPAISGKLILPEIEFPRFAGNADPPFQAGFCVMGSGSRPRANGAVRAADSARMASLPDYPRPINQPRYPLVQKATFHLDDDTFPLAFLELEQSKNEAGGRAPLHAARV